MLGEEKEFIFYHQILDERKNIKPSVYPLEHLIHFVETYFNLNIEDSVNIERCDFDHIESLWVMNRYEDVYVIHYEMSKTEIIVLL